MNLYSTKEHHATLNFSDGHAAILSPPYAQHQIL